jgi:hypothetical protein
MDLNMEMNGFDLISVYHTTYFNNIKPVNRKIMQPKHHHSLQNGCFQPQRAFNFRSIPCTVSFRLENEKWGEVFKMHPVLNVITP